MQKIIFQLVFVLLISSCSNWVFIRETRRVGASKSIEESKARGAFIFEYEPSVCYVYDSICVRIHTAFAEYDCWYADWHTDSIEINKKAEHIVILFEKKSYPGYYGDSLTYATDSSIINWHINGFYRPFPSQDFIYYSNGSYERSLAPDILILPIIEIEQYRNNTYNREHPEWDSVLKEDTIGYFKLVKKDKTK